VVLNIADITSKFLTRTYSNEEQLPTVTTITYCYNSESESGSQVVLNIAGITSKFLTRTYSNEEQLPTVTTVKAKVEVKWY
jgi:hypothetical protein